MERDDLDIWRMIERNPSIAFENESIAYDILAAEKQRQAEPSALYEGPVDDLLDGPGAFADGLKAAYHAARTVVDRDTLAGVDDTTIIDNILSELAKLAGVP